MEKLATVGRFFFTLPMVAFGVQQLAYLDFVTRVFPNLPGWIPGHPYLAGLSGLFLIASSLAITMGTKARPAALLLGVVVLASFILLYLPLLIINTPNGGLWTRAGKALAFSGGSFLVAGSLAEKPDGLKEKYIPLGRFFFTAFLILCGIEHFIYVDFVATMVPSWIPWHVFWTYFAGVALIAGGVGMNVPLTRSLAALLTGLMIFLWLFLVHIPRASANLRDANETTAVFEALAMSGVAFLVAAVCRNRQLRLADAK